MRKRKSWVVDIVGWGLRSRHTPQGTAVHRQRTRTCKRYRHTHMRARMHALAASNHLHAPIETYILPQPTQARAGWCTHVLGQAQHPRRCSRAHQTRTCPQPTHTCPVADTHVRTHAHAPANADVVTPTRLVEEPSRLFLMMHFSSIYTC